MPLVGFRSRLVPVRAQQQPLEEIKHFPRDLLSLQSVFGGLCFPSAGIDGPLNHTANYGAEFIGLYPGARSVLEVGEEEPALEGNPWQLEM